jgi:hypothetical protein
LASVNGEPFLALVLFRSPNGTLTMVFPADSATKKTRRRPVLKEIRGLLNGCRLEEHRIVQIETNSRAE